MTRPSPVLAAALLLVAAASGRAWAQGQVVVADAWSRPATPGLPGVAYLTLTNRGAQPERLVSASSPRVGTVTLHRSSMSKGVMTMTALPDGLALAAGQTVKLAPGGYHLMLRQVKGGLKLGERYPLTLRFTHAHAQTVQVEVRSGGDAMAGMAMH